MDKLVTLDHVSKHFHVGKGKNLVAVNDISLDIYKGETLGVVGESGCGKSTLGRVVMGIYPATSGKMLYNGKQVNLRHTKDRYVYSQKAQIIFQDPYASLNPRMTVGSIIAEGMEIHNMYDKEKRMQRVYELLETVGLNREHANRFPHEFSGGMRQRAALIRTLALQPDLLLLDEPFSALDYQTRLNVSDDIGKIIRRESKTAILVTHDISEALSMADRVLILSARPATVKDIIEVHFDIPDRTPLASRNAPEFKTYFNLIWKELNDHDSTIQGSAAVSAD